jgi:hypothetical protein
MSLKTQTFLIDANTLITPFQKYYPFNWAPRFWQCMEEAILSKDVILLDVVKKEILKGQKEERKDELARWIERFGANVVLSRQNEKIITMYGEVLEYVKTCGLYKSNTLTEWAKEDVADGWLIASACIGGHTIVTFETSNKSLNPSNPAKMAKIPDVCDHFSVECKDLFHMMKNLDFKL